MSIKFLEFPKMPRLSREMIITEKIDGTNASIFIQHEVLEEGDNPEIVARLGAYTLRIGSRTKWITPGKEDNAGFAAWVVKNSEELFTLGEGQHFGEWWGSGIQRGYGLTKGDKRFSLFNTARWTDDVRPKCCSVVPVLYSGPFETLRANIVLDELRESGSIASPGFMDAEGIIIYHVAANMGFKKTIKNDETPKSLIK